MFLLLNNAIWDFLVVVVFMVVCMSSLNCHRWIVVLLFARVGQFFFSSAEEAWLLRFVLESYDVCFVVILINSAKDVDWRSSGLNGFFSSVWMVFSPLEWMKVNQFRFKTQNFGSWPITFKLCWIVQLVASWTVISSLMPVKREKTVFRGEYYRLPKIPDFETIQCLTSIVK